MLVVVTYFNIHIIAKLLTMFFIIFPKAEERSFSVEEMLEADEVFCTGTAVGISEVGSATYKDKRYNIIQIHAFFRSSTTTIIMEIIIMIA